MWQYVLSTGENLVQQWWMTWASGPSTNAAHTPLWPCSCPIPDVPLPLHTDDCWVCQPNDLVGWMPTSSWWEALVTWSLVRCSVSVRTSSMPEATFQMVYRCSLQMAWPCSRTLWVYLVILLLGHAISSTWCFIFPPQVTLISIESAQSFGLSNMGFALHPSFAVTQSVAGTAFCVTW